MSETIAPRTSRSIAVIYNMVEDWDRIDINSVMDGVNMIRDSLEAIGHRTCLIRVDEGVGKFVERLEALKPDAVFNLCEGFGERAAGEFCVTGLLELLEIPYTGSPPLALALALEKPISKLLFVAKGIPTPRFVVYDTPPSEPPGLRFPVMLKLAGEDASVGITRDNVAVDWIACRKRLAELLEEHHSPVMVEEYIDGREFTVAMMDGEPLLIEEIEFDVEPKILCYSAKWATDSAEYQGTKALFTPSISDAHAAQIRRIAKDVWNTIGLRDYGRVDFRMDARGDLFVLEANPNPDITSDSGYRKCLAHSNIPYDEFIGRVIGNALQRRK